MLHGFLLCSLWGIASRGSSLLLRLWEARHWNRGLPPGLVRPLMRPLVGRKLAGVCQGLSNHLGWDVTLVRVIAVVLAVFTFPIGLLLYGVMWLVMPEELRALPPTTHLDPIS